MLITRKTILIVIIWIAYVFTLRKKHDIEAMVLWIALVLSILWGD